MSNPSDYSIVLRFLGTTPATSNIVNTYNSIIYQISRIFNINAPKPNVDKEILRSYLIEQFLMIKMLFPRKKLIIILDSIDQLNPDDYDLKWFIDNLPDNVKMIYSTLPNHGDILETFKHFELELSNYIEIKNLNIELSSLIVSDWLKKANRSLSLKQWDTIKSLFERAVLFPLYIRLVFDIISKWTSFYEPDNEFLKCLNIDTTIKYLFQLHEIEHGKLLFSRAIIYMSSFKNGISENEIEDILSLDDDVLYDIFEFHAPPIRKLPSALVNKSIF